MRSHRSQRFEPTVQWLLALFGFFIAFPIVDVPVIGVSITFPIFLATCYLVRARWGCLFRVKGLLDSFLLWFFLVCAFSILLAPDVDIDESAIFLSDCKSFMYLAYWFSVYLFFRKWSTKINLKRLSIFFLLGLFVCSAVVVFGELSHGGFYYLGPARISQNTYAFNTIACLGVSCWYLFSRYGVVSLVPLSCFFVYTELSSQSRTGAIIIIIQILLFAVVTILGKRMKVRRLFIKFFLVGVILFVLSGFALNTSSMGKTLASWVKPYNEELAQLLENPERVQERDKSWLIRQTQIDKGLDLFSRNPLTGVGWGHYRYIRAEIDVKQYKYLHREYDDYALRRSSHNSYIQVMAEMGIVGIVLFVLIQLYVIKQTLYHFIYLRNSIGPCLLGVSLLGVTAYFWVVSAVTGAVWYVVLGLFAGVEETVRKRL